MIHSNLHVLRNLDPTQSSFDLKNQILETTKRRSNCKNFLNSVIHILTFTFVSKNSRLDRVSKHIFEEIKTKIAHQISPEEKELFIDALKNAIIVIKKNGGSKSKEAKTLLANVEKIKVLQKKSSTHSSPKTQSSKSQSPSATTPKSADHLFIEKMKANPPPTNGAPDLFFKNLVNELVEGTCFDLTLTYVQGTKSKNDSLKSNLTKIAPYVFSQDSPERMQIFAKKIHQKCLFPYVTLIPDSILKQLDQKKLLGLADAIIKNSNPSKVALKAIAEALSPDHIADQQGKPVENLVPRVLLRWKTLLPFFDQEKQVRLISMFFHKPYQAELLDVIGNLDANLWEIASQNFVLKYSTDYDKLPIPLFARVLSGQKNNFSFFESFVGSDISKESNLSRRLELIENIKLEVFENYFFSQAHFLSEDTLSQLLYLLKIHSNQNHAQKILECLTRSLFQTPFNSLCEADYFKLITENCSPEQLKKLPINQYESPEIRMWLACVTGRFTAGIFEKNAPLLTWVSSRDLLNSIHQCGLPNEEIIIKNLLSLVKYNNMFNVAEGFYASEHLPYTLFQGLRAWLQNLTLPSPLATRILSIPPWHT